MRIEVINRDALQDYRRACKTTEGRTPEPWEPKDPVRYWVKQIVANHSTLRFVRFTIEDTAPRAVIMQLIRATKGAPQPEVQSSRPDWTGKPRDTDPNAPKMYTMLHTAESFVEMAKQRLCHRTEEQTRQYMLGLVQEMERHSDPFIKAVAICSLPACMHNGGYCPEIKSCGMFPSKADKLLKAYAESQR